MEQAILGRGLRALIPSARSHRDKTTSNVLEVSLSSIQTNRHQPRTHFDEKLLNELADSIKQKGVLQPVLLRKLNDKEEIYELIAGERRFRACCVLGLKSIPAIVKDVSSEESGILALIENIQRKDLNPIEKAKSYRRYMDICHVTQEQLASKLCLNRSSLTNTLRLLNLPRAIQEKVQTGIISFSHAKLLLSLSSEKEQKEAVTTLIQNELSLVQFAMYLKKKDNTEKIAVVSAKEGKDDTRSLRKNKEIEKKTNKYLSLEKELTQICNAPATIHQNIKTKKGHIQIKFDSIEILKNIVDRIKTLSQDQN